MIHILSNEVIDRIAAGEVVERPVSVVKELVENSIDAGASEIEIVLEGGGKKLIRVVDDGNGMTPADLQAAFMRHATSKLDRVEDLLHIASLGFRGEALASIGAVSRSKITSRFHELPGGSAVENVGGKVSTVKPAPSAAGTRVEVRDLFYNVPPRLKFLKGDSTELSHVVEGVTRFILAWPGLGFRLLHNGRMVVNCEKGLTLVERIERCFGRDMAESLLSAGGKSGGMRVSGFVGRPEAARRDMRRSYIMINGRYVRDRVVHAAVRQAYRERLPGRFHPIYILDISIPPDDVDVNVHPMKQEVRFRDGTSVFAGVLEIVERALSGRDRPTAATLGLMKKKPARAHPYPGRDDAGGMREKLIFGLDGAGRTPPAGAGTAVREARAALSGRFLQVHNSYLLFQVEEGIAVVDQHALHERVLYQSLREEYESGGIHLQNLLVPAVVELGKELGCRREEFRLELGDLGIKAEPFGENDLKVTAVPALAGRADPQELAKEVLGRLAAGEQGNEVYLEILHSMACRAAVMAGDSLHEEELAELVGKIDTTDHAERCPHGRPTTFLLTHRDIEEMFRRRGF